MEDLDTVLLRAEVEARLETLSSANVSSALQANLSCTSARALYQCGLLGATGLSRRRGEHKPQLHSEYAIDGSSLMHTGHISKSSPVYLTHTMLVVLCEAMGQVQILLTARMKDCLTGIQVYQSGYSFTIFLRMYQHEAQLTEPQFPGVMLLDKPWLY